METCNAYELNESIRIMMGIILDAHFMNFHTQIAYRQASRRWRREFPFIKTYTRVYFRHVFGISKYRKNIDENFFQSHCFLISSFIFDCPLACVWFLLNDLP